MVTRTLCDVDAVGLTMPQIKEILTKIPMTRWNRVKGALVCRNFDHARKVRMMRRVFMIGNISKEIQS